MAIATKTTQAEFIEVKSLGVSVFVSQTDANHARSMDILAKNGLRPLTCQEALFHLTQNPELKEQLKEKRFYLVGEGPYFSGRHAIDENGRTSKITSAEAYGNLEQTVTAYSGTRPLSLIARVCNSFVLGAFNSPGGVARAVVGVKQAQTNPEAAAQKIDLKLVYKFQSTVAKLDAAAEAGVLNPEIAKVAKEVLRAIE